MASDRLFQLRIGNGGQPIGLDRIQFGLWSLAKAPLILSCDLLKLSQKQLDVIRNTEVSIYNEPDGLTSVGHRREPGCPGSPGKARVRFSEPIPDLGGKTEQW